MFWIVFVVMKFLEVFRFIKGLLFFFGIGGFFFFFIGIFELLVWGKIYLEKRILNKWGILKVIFENEDLLNRYIVLDFYFILGKLGLRKNIFW